MADDAGLVAERNAKLAALGPWPPWWRPFARRRHRLAIMAIMAVNVSVCSAMFRELYPASKVEAVAMQQNAAIAWLTKVKR